MAIGPPFPATGLVPVSHINGSSWSGKTRTYYIPSGDTNAYYIGDPVLSTNTADTNGIPGMIKDTTGTNTPRGVLVGVYPVIPVGNSLQGVSLTLENTYIPATKTQNYYIMVADAADTIFAITDDGLNAGDVVAADCGLNFSLTIAAPTLPVQMSATVINTSTLATTNTLPYKLLGLAQIAGNQLVTSGVGYRWLCMANLHELSSAGTTAV